MSDKRPQRTDDSAPDLDFSGLLPGDDQPRRRRRTPGQRTGRRSRQQTKEEQAPEESLSESETQGESAHPIQKSHESVESPTRGEPSEEADEKGGGEKRDSETISENETTQAPGEAVEPLSGQRDIESSEEAEGLSHSVETGAYDSGAYDAGPAGARAAPAEERYASDGPEESARREASRAQAALVEGRDLDLILQRVSSLTPQQRGAYKSTLVLSEDHYELLADMCKEFRRRGFKGRDATISNVVSVGLEVMRQTLDAEKNLPGE